MNHSPEQIAHIFSSWPASFATFCIVLLVGYHQYLKTKAANREDTKGEHIDRGFITLIHQLQSQIEAMECRIGALQNVHKENGILRAKVEALQDKNLILEERIKELEIAYRVRKVGRDSEREAEDREEVRRTAIKEYSKEQPEAT